jgi:hypothetical protein
METLKPRSGSSKYQEGYWLSSDNIWYVMTAILGDDTVRAPLAYDALAGRLGMVVQRVKHLKEKGRHAAAEGVKKDYRWGKWTTQVCNCGASSGKGTHWILTSCFQSAQPKVTMWEPLGSPVYAADAKTAFVDVCGLDKVESHIVDEQKDGYSCGYIAVWWAIHQHLLHVDGARMDRPPETPAGWNQIVWTLCRAQKKGLSAKKLGLRPIMDRAWDGLNTEFVPAVLEHMENLFRG